MSKTDIDYSNTIIYKITCKDTENKDVYVGHTTNFVQRKHAHKQGCNNPKSTNYKCKLYNTIRENGGWDNWVMEIISFCKCYDQYEARIKEQEYFLSLNANLNSVEPKPKEKPLPVVKPIKQSQICEFTTNKNKYCCVRCDYSSCNKTDYTKHISTKKHIQQLQATVLDETNTNNYKNMQNDFVCQICDKKYNDNSGLWRHKKKCFQEPNLVNQLLKQNDDFKQLILEQNKMFIFQNQELQKQILEHCKNGITQNNSTKITL
jgi:hypothetical protein